MELPKLWTKFLIKLEIFVHIGQNIFRNGRKVILIDIQLTLLFMGCFFMATTWGGIYTPPHLTYRYGKTILQINT